MKQTDPIIRTKIRQPFIRPNLVPRPQIQERIALGLHCPLTLVVAPAGFGKTTLVASCVANGGLPIAWLSLDKDDNQAGFFLTYLIAALQRADVRIGDEAAQLMAGMQPASPEAVLTSLINDLDDGNTEIALVLDDYQLISSQAVHEEVSFLLDHCPHTFHLLIATRSDPPLPLARLRAHGQMVELRTADLRFTEPEAAQFLNDVMGIRLDAGSVAVLEERTEGWIAGLQMAALSMRDREDVRGFIEGFSGTHRHILDYLLEEILAGQSPEIQHFLLFTSILERLTAPLCDAVLKSDEGSKWEGDDRSTHSESHALRQASSILEYLERANLFLVPLDDERLWYRYHHLFADLLRARLHQAQPDSIRLLRIRAAAWLEQNGYISEAIQQLFTAKEIGQAADLIERYGPVSWTESDPSVMRMADSLPPEMLVTRPKIGLYQAWLLICQGNIEKAIPLLTDLAQHLAAVEPDPRLRWMQTFIALALAFLFQANPLPEYQELDEIPAIEPILRDAADVLYGMALGRRGETDRAAEISVRCIQREKTSQGMLAFPSLASFLAVIYLMQGRLHTAASLCREYIVPIQEKGFRIVSTAGNMEIVLGEVQYEWNQLDEAERQIREGLQANEPWQNIMTDAFGLLALVLVLRAKGDYAGAMQIVTKFETRLQGDSRPREFQEDFRTLRVRVQLASGDLQNAVQWAEQVQQSEDFHLHEGYYQLTLAHIRLAQGKHTEVEKMLTEAPSLEVIGNRISRQIEINLLLAAAIAGQNRLREAFELIESCLVLAEPEGYIQVFLEGGEPVRELLAAYLNASACEHKNYAQKILEAFGPTEMHEAVGVQRAGLVDILTPRELDVLRLLAEGCSNRQIAEKLFLAEGTVKFYLHTVLEKLGVHSRTQAILVAKERNLV